jgi:acyl dehydratase
MSGMYYEEFEPGATIEHPITRTVTETDNLLFSVLTHNVQPLHLDVEFSKKSIHGQVLVNSIFTLGLVTGVAVGDTTLGTTFGNLGFEKIAFPGPVFLGDTIRCATEILEKRESKSRPNAGIVAFMHRGYNQRDEVICECHRIGLMMKRPVAESAETAPA